MKTTTKELTDSIRRLEADAAQWPHDSEERMNIDELIDAKCKELAARGEEC